MMASALRCLLTPLGCFLTPLGLRHDDVHLVAAAAASSGSGKPLPHVPPCIHATLPLDPATPHTLIVGDVHGCLDELKDLLAAAGYSSNDDEKDGQGARMRVVLVGDLVNKGPASAETVRFARERGFYSVRGNHDDNALRARAAAMSRLLDEEEPPPEATWHARLSSEDVEWLQSLPYTLQLEGLGVLVVHAGVVPGMALEDQDLRTMYTMRNLLPRRGEEAGAKAGEGAMWEATAKVDAGGQAWAEVWRPNDGSAPASVKQIVFGHDAKRGVQRIQPPEVELLPGSSTEETKTCTAIGLDSGCCYGKGLTGLLLPEGRLVQVPSRRVYSQPDGG